MYKRKYFIGFIIFLSFYVYPLFADVPGYNQLTLSVGAEKKRSQFSNDVAQKLYDYRMEIEENAYQTTMRLCPAYRIAKGMGLPEYHRRLSDSYYVNHESSEVREWALNMNDEYGEVLSSYLQEWLYVMYEGAVQPLSNIGGVKADWIQNSPEEISFFDMEQWFYSFYTRYLVDSTGFVQGAMHCLGTMDGDEINQFAVTILAVDTGMSALGYVLTFWTGDKILRLIIHGLRWSSRPVGRAMVRFLNSKNISPKTVKTYAIIAGVFGLGGLGVWTTDAFLDSQAEQEFGQDIISVDLERAIKNKQLQLQEQQEDFEER